jgi:hypothetical protein
MPSRPWWLLLLLLSAGCSTGNESQRYRGDYTFGHEVSIFCPQINAQCYWLGPDTSQAVRAELKTLYEEIKPGLYKPVCVVIEGKIDRDTARNGFAADYDGLINITRLHGDCDASAVVTPGDLNHHRWFLVEHNGVAIDVKLDLVVLDFGERLFVEVSEACRKLSGFAELDDNRIAFARLEAKQSDCDTSPTVEPLFTQQDFWQVSLVGREILLLKNGRTRLGFKKHDWR